jgi:hypothetical protein
VSNIQIPHRNDSSSIKNIKEEKRRERKREEYEDRDTLPQGKTRAGHPLIAIPKHWHTKGNIIAD